VVVGKRRHSIGSQRALGSKRRSTAELDVILTSLVDRLGRRLRAAKRVCRTVTLRLRFADFTRATRSRTLVRPTEDTETILTAARGLLVTALPLITAQGLTLLGISLSNLDNEGGGVQLMLPFDGRPDGVLDTTLDTVRDRFGAAAITRAALLGHREGPEMPMLPD
jgi:DNA polymerase-4